ncbi:hypothetical protein [Streptomyces sp. NPDC048106]|uniref:hypothetical protein n=1 Tax=Streptomyces sp. NPDC048106 TaxID=3155750 RepID=UPI0034557467
MSAEQEDFGQGAGSVAFAMGFDGGFPPRGLAEGRWRRAGAGLVDESLLVVIEFEAGSIAGDEPRALVVQLKSVLGPSASSTPSLFSRTPGLPSGQAVR